MRVAYTSPMDTGSGFFIFTGIVLLAWLMWSSKTGKETFLTYAWMGMIVIGLVNLAYLWIR